MKLAVYQSALGIATGDVVTTSYGTGPFEVSYISGPRYMQRWVGFIFVTDYPLISLGLIKPGSSKDNYAVNDIRQEGDRWFTESGDEVFVTKGSASTAVQMDLFAPVAKAMPAPYAFDPDVDYRAPYVWRCEHCEYDFNAPSHSRDGRVVCGALCEGCGRVAARLMFRSRADNTPHKSVSCLLADFAGMAVGVGSRGEPSERTIAPGDIGVQRVSEPTYRVFNEDCITGMAERLEPESVDLTVTSIPFGALFMYSGKTEDIGNCHDGIDMQASQFGLHMRFFIEQLHRVTAPGCIACIHIQQLLTTKVQHGYIGRRDFRGAVIDMFTAGGFDWTGEIVISKNPQAVAQRQKLSSLLFATGKRDARALAPTVNDMVLVFRKPGQGVPVPAIYDPVDNPHGWLSTEEWIRDAHGVWTDIREMDVLTNWKEARESDQERHVCPLQLTVIRRCVRLYSNPGATVLDPFMGIGSTAVVAIEQGRNAVGFELKESYHAQALSNCERGLKARDVDQMPLFAAVVSS